MIPSFAALSLDGESHERPFANSLTITRDDFSNYQHLDADKIQIAYGLWWAAHLVKGSTNHYEIRPDYDHDRIKGGAFVWGDFGIAVDFEKCVTLPITNLINY
jgi:hypothetical protein